MSRSIVRQSLRAILWTAGESFFVAALSFGAFLVMARVLEPRDFGIVALAAAFIFFVNLVVGHSFSDALIQRSEIDRDDMTTAFWSTLLIGAAFAAACLAGAEALASAFREPEIGDVLRWLAPVIPITALGVVPGALMRRDMRFRELTLCNVAGRGTGAVVGVSMALSGHGLWSLVGQQIAGSIVASLAVALSCGWRPKISFSLARARSLGAFGIHVSLSQVVSGIGEQALSLTTGALFGTTALGYLNIALRMLQLIRTLVSGALYHVSFSAFSRIRGDVVLLRSSFLKATQLSCLAGFPVAVLLIVLAEPIIRMAFGDQWRPAAPLLALLGIELFPLFFGMFFSASYRALGRPSIVLWMATVYLAVGLAGIVGFAWAGLAAAAAAWAIRSVILMPIHFRLISRLMGLGYTEVGRMALAPLVASTAMAVSILGLVNLGPGDDNPLYALAYGAVGLLVYAVTLHVVAPDLLRIGIGTLRLMMTPSAAAKGSAGTQ